MGLHFTISHRHGSIARLRSHMYLVVVGIMSVLKTNATILRNTSTTWSSTVVIAEFFGIGSNNIHAPSSASVSHQSKIPSMSHASELRASSQ